MLSTYHSKNTVQYILFRNFACISLSFRVSTKFPVYLLLHEKTEAMKLMTPNYMNK